MRTTNLERNSRSRLSQQNRSHSPNSFTHRPNYNNSTVSVHSQHLWNMLEETQLFPEQIPRLIHQQQRNLSNYKKAIQRQKVKVNQDVESMKNELIHNIDDLKISILAQLDNIYCSYMTKYANLKSQIMEIKHIKDQLQMDVQRRINVVTPKYGTAKDSYKPNNNANIMSLLAKNNLQMKKCQMFKYISDLQKQKIIPLNELTKDLVLLTQYENGYYQSQKFQAISQALILDIKAYLQGIHERKFEFLRSPEQICQTEDKPVLDAIYQDNSPVININTAPNVPQRNNSTYNVSPSFNFNHINTVQNIGDTVNPVRGNVTSNNISVKNSNNMYDNLSANLLNNYRFQNQPIVSKIDYKSQQGKVLAISQQQQSIGFDWVQNISLSPSQTINSITQDIILCALQISRNIIAVGGKDGIINIYEVSSGKKLANLRGHRASICKLALVINNGKKYLASGSDLGCNCIVLWDTSTWNMRMRIESHKAAVTAIVDLGDNRSLVSGSYDKTINVYNINSEGKILYNLPVNKTSVTAILLNCSGDKMISCGLDNIISVWQVVRGNNRIVETMFLKNIIENNTTICSIITSILQPDVVLVGTKDGQVKLINTNETEPYKIYSVCNSAVIELVAVERQTKSELPIVVCWPCKQNCLKVINTESGRVTNVSTKGCIQFGCGIGPKGFFLSSGTSLAMLSQTRDARQIDIFKLDVIS